MKDHRFNGIIDKCNLVVKTRGLVSHSSRRSDVTGWGRVHSVVGSLKGCGGVANKTRFFSRDSQLLFLVFADLHNLKRW